MSISFVQQAKIAEAVARMAAKTSQVKVANQAGVSTATINHIVNKQWATINGNMFKQIAVNLKLDFTWKSAQIQNYRVLNGILNLVQTDSISVCISEHAGRGKTHTFRKYAQDNDNVIHVECANSWSKKSYMKHLMSAAGLSQVGTLEVLVTKFINKLKTMHQPIVIIDQFDKLKDSQVDLFMDFYNELDGYCGFVLSGVKALEKRILNGVNRDKIGYAELYSRVGRKFITLDPISKKDVRLICHANDILDPLSIKHVYVNCEGDLRRVKRDIEIFQKKHQKALKETEVEAFEVVPA